MDWGWWGRGAFRSTAIHFHASSNSKRHLPDHRVTEVGFYGRTRWSGLRQLRSLTADEHINYPIRSFAFPFWSRTRRGSELAETAISCGGRDSAKAAVARSGAPVGAPDFFLLAAQNRAANRWRFRGVYCPWFSPSAFSVSSSIWPLACKPRLD